MNDRHVDKTSMIVPAVLFDSGDGVGGDGSNSGSSSGGGRNKLIFCLLLLLVLMVLKNVADFVFSF